VDTKHLIKGVRVYLEQVWSLELGWTHMLSGLWKEGVGLLAYALGFQVLRRIAR
jgi:hypothetical protein